LRKIEAPAAIAAAHSKNRLRPAAHGAHIAREAGHIDEARPVVGSPIGAQRRPAPAPTAPFGDKSNAAAPESHYI
jgi:hypothetical protein